MFVILQMRQELEKIRRRLEAELAEAREQLAAKTSQLDELQTMMNRREEELQLALNKSARRYIYQPDTADFAPVAAVLANSIKQRCPTGAATWRLGRNITRRL